MVDDVDVKMKDYNVVIMMDNPDINFKNIDVIVFIVIDYFHRLFDVNLKNDDVNRIYTLKILTSI